MVNELITKLTQGLGNEIIVGRSIESMSSKFYDVIYGRSMISANKEIEIEKIEAQKDVITTKIMHDAKLKQTKAELVKVALNTIESMSRCGTLTDERMDCIERIVREADVQID